jgi:hypothetical protein
MLNCPISILQWLWTHLIGEILTPKPPYHRDRPLSSFALETETTSLMAVSAIQNYTPSCRDVADPDFAGHKEVPIDCEYSLCNSPFQC